MFAQQTGQILLQWLSHFPPAAWNSCRPLSPQERWGGATSSDVEFCNFIRCKSFIRRLWSVELCCILSQAPSKVEQAVGWFGLLHKNVSCTDSCWVNWAWGRCVVISATVQGKISCIRSKILCNDSPYLFFLQVTTTSRKGKEGFLSPLSSMRPQAKSPMHLPTSSLDCYRNTICITVFSDP